MPSPQIDPYTTVLPHHLFGATHSWRIFSCAHAPAYDRNSISYLDQIYGEAFGNNTVHFISIASTSETDNLS
jgi:hypothetical protein